MFEEGRETVGHHLRNGGTGNEHPLVHVELPTGIPGLVGQVGGRYPLLYTADNQLGDTVTLAAGQTGVAHGRVYIRWQM